MNMTPFLDKIAEAANAQSRVKAGDYEKDGILFCGKCNSPKQVRVPWPDGTEHTVGCLCKCEGERRDREEALRKEEERQRAIRALRVNGIQDREAREKRFDNSNMTKELATAKRYATKWDEIKAQNIGLLLWGNTGNGKTHTAACIANELIDRGVPVLMTSFSKILNAATGMFAEERVAYLNSLSEFDLLVIDDLGAERQSEFALEIVYTVVDERYKAKKPMVITTNTPLNELKNAKNMDYQRIYDRVLEMCVPIQFKADSVRKEAANKKLELARQLLGGD